jgi:hypothetical protein
MEQTATEETMAPLKETGKRPRLRILRDVASPVVTGLLAHSSRSRVL